MQETKGHCKHGEFILTEGCPQCLAEKRAEPETKNFEEVRHECKSCGAEWTVRMLLVENSQGITLPTYTGSDTYLCPKCKSANTIMFSNREKVEQPTTESTVLVPKAGEDSEITNYYQEAIKLQRYAESRVIKTIEDIKIATDDLTIISKLKKAMEEKRKEYITPLQDQVKQINETYKTLMAPVLEADKITRDKMLAFDAEQRRIRAEQERINALRLEAAKKEKELTGEITEPVKLVEVAPEAPKRVSTDLGTVGQRMIRKWELLDFAQVPHEYLILDSAKIGKVVRAGIPSIPGIRIWEEPILTVNAR